MREISLEFYDTRNYILTPSGIKCHQMMWQFF